MIGSLFFQCNCNRLVGRDGQPLNRFVNEQVDASGSSLAVIELRRNWTFHGDKITEVPRHRFRVAVVVRVDVVGFDDITTDIQRRFRLGVTLARQRALLRRQFQADRLGRIGLFRGFFI